MYKDNEDEDDDDDIVIAEDINEELEEHSELDNFQNSKQRIYSTYSPCF